MCQNKTTICCRFLNCLQPTEEKNDQVLCTVCICVCVKKSVSTEELSAEMANLEGLMKDLNAITQHEFHC
jgi:hypothetical protein